MPAMTEEQKKAKKREYNQRYRDKQLGEERRQKLGEARAAEKADELPDAPEPAPQSPHPPAPPRRWWQRKNKAETPTPSRPSKPVRRRGGRVSVDQPVGMVWGVLAGGLVSSGRDVPVGRMMAYQAPMVGHLIDDAVKGTVIDAILQPFAKASQQGEGIALVIGPPLCVGWLERHPEQQQAILPILRYLVASMLVGMAPAVKAQKEKEKAMGETLAELFPDLEAPDQAVDAIIESLFVPIPTTGGNETNGPEPANARASEQSGMA